MDIVSSFEIENEKFYYYDIRKVFKYNDNLKKLPKVLKILLEANLRKIENENELERIVNIFSKKESLDIVINPSRLILEEDNALLLFSDFISMKKENSNVDINIMTDVVTNTLEEVVSHDKYKLLKYSLKNFSNLRIIPPKKKYFHPINLEFLSTVLHLEKKDEKFFIYPETILGKNTFGVLGLNVNSLNLKLAALGEDIKIVLPKVIGVNVKGKLKEGILSSEIIKSLKFRLNEFKSENKIVEFYGDGLIYLTLEDRIKILSMANDLNIVSFFFPIDNKTIEYYNKTRKSDDFSKLVKNYLQLQDLFYNKEETLEYDEVLTLDLSVLNPWIIKGKRVNDNIAISSLVNLPIINETPRIKDHDIVLSLIECFEPSFLIHMALIAKKASEFGLKIHSRIKVSTSLDLQFLKNLNLIQYLENIGLNLEKNNSSFDLDSNIEADIRHNNLNVCSVSSQEKVLEFPLVKSNYIASPSLVLIYTLIGSLKFNIFEDVISLENDNEIRLKQLWPTSKEVSVYLEQLNSIFYQNIYKEIFKEDEFWKALEVDSLELKYAKLFTPEKNEVIDIKNASILALFENKISTSQIMPKGQISLFSTTAKYLESKGIKSFDFNTFESRITDFEVMTRGIFDTTEVHNKMVSKEGSFTMDYEKNEIISIYEKAMQFIEKNEPLVIFTGTDFGIGEFDEWSLKGMKLLGVKAIISKSFSKMYKDGLVKYGILPLEFIDDDIKSLKLKGQEKICIKVNEIKANSKINILIRKELFEVEIEVKSRLDNLDEVEYFKSGGIFPLLLNKL